MVSIFCNSKKNNTASGDSLLDALSEARIFSITKTDQGDFVIMENCDDYFRAVLTKEQMIDLSDEIKEFAK